MSRIICLISPLFMVALGCLFLLLGICATNDPLGPRLIAFFYAAYTFYLSVDIYKGNKEEAADV